jgi:hypothetical protein
VLLRLHRQGDSSGYLLSPCIASFAAVCLVSIHFSACVRLPSTQAKMLSSLSSKQGCALTQRVQFSAARPGTIAVHSSSKSNRMSRKMTAFAYPAVGRVFAPAIVCKAETRKARTTERHRRLRRKVRISVMELVHGHIQLQQCYGAHRCQGCRHYVGNHSCCNAWIMLRVTFLAVD